GTAESPAIVEQPLTSHAFVKPQRRIAEFRKKDEEVDVAVQESSRRLRHHASAEAEPVVLPAKIDLAQLAGKLAVVGLAPCESDQSPMPVLQYQHEIAPVLLAEDLLPLRGARGNCRSTRRTIRRVPCCHV